MKRTDEITNSEDIIDSRDVIARIEYLESELQAIHEDELKDEDGNEIDGPDFDTWLESRHCDEAQELKSLRALAEEADGCSDWQYGETLIRDSYFEDYARQLADDIGAIDSNATWPLCHIDWEAAADSLKQDYTSVDFGGVDYWIRS